MAVTAIVEVIAAIAQVGLACAAGAGVFVAYSQLNAWKSEHVVKTRAETSLKLLSRAKSIRGSLAAVRSAMESVPADEVYQVKWHRLHSYNSDFDSLRELQVLHEALIGDDEVKEAVGVLFDARQEIYAALDTLNGWNLGESPSASDAALHMKLTRIVSSVGTSDCFGHKITAAISMLEDKLLPLIRL